MKLTFDSLQKARVYMDDSQIDKITIQRFHIIKGGNIQVEISER
ncbi:MAG: RusA family crossover junction endodeoxyribonuclease [Candidatus Paracaedibacteraceae bacterium]|nr:RusA family crossover junction endodeoxyribonuclease [Candidatus Paracaedibacteraceae bacterium]